MKQSLKKVIGFSIEATDGPKGKVKDFLFDEDTWVLRYMEADYGNIFQNKRVLVPGIFFSKVYREDKQFFVSLTQNNIENGPKLEEALPVSKEYEKTLSTYYNYDWPWLYTVPSGNIPYHSARPLAVPSRDLDEKDLNTNLRSFDEIKGYDVRTIDEKFGHIEDFIVDDVDWQILYVIVDTSAMPWGKKVILPISRLKEISYTDNEVYLDLHTETIKNAPEFDPEKHIEESYERGLFDYYTKY